MTSPKPAPELVDMFYLHMRSALIETAASFDRIQAAAGGEEAFQGEALSQLREAARIVSDAEPKRAERILKLLSVGELSE